MAVVTTNYGNWTTHTGTLAEVMAAIKSKLKSQIVSGPYYDGNITGKTVAVEYGG